MLFGTYTRLSGYSIKWLTHTCVQDEIQVDLGFGLLYDYWYLPIPYTYGYRGSEGRCAKYYLLWRQGVTR